MGKWYLKDPPYVVATAGTFLKAGARLLKIDKNGLDHVYLVASSRLLEL